MPEERLDAAAQDRDTADVEQLLRAIRPEAAPPSTGGNDGCDAH
jgi:hypothetical protein